MTPVTIRQAGRSDAEALTQFAARLFRSTYGDDTSVADLDAHIGKEITVERQAADIADPDGAVFLALADERIVGYAHFAMRENGSSAFLSSLYIDTDWRGAGVSRRLLATVMDEATARGAGRLDLTVYERNARAIRFYEKVGFTTTGTTIFTVGDDRQTDLTMAFALARPVSG